GEAEHQQATDQHEAEHRDQRQAIETTARLGGVELGCGDPYARRLWLARGGALRLALRLVGCFGGRFVDRVVWLGLAHEVTRRWSSRRPSAWRRPRTARCHWRPSAGPRRDARGPARRTPGRSARPTGSGR